MIYKRHKKYNIEEKEEELKKNKYFPLTVGYF